ncbi:putative fasciclin-like arabinogalactan protein [Vigna angularis]|uniref:Putative fasciclin-like arabinogalactan protein n=1 Tax=Phaseolus angularis TaxID=3914 RepID=A0A8T0JQ46_PHAAN|nr:putative fasciclin-like arabinogalactan protein [Vigna angularis]
MVHHDKEGTKKKVHHEREETKKKDHQMKMEAMEVEWTTHQRRNKAFKEFWEYRVYKIERSLTSLPFGASILTLLPNHSLTITTTSPTITISINNVTLVPSRVFHHPNLTIFPTTNFFDPRFHLTPPHPPSLACNRCKLTLFAPPDKALSHAAHNLTHLSALLRHHLVPCKIVWRELAELRDGTLIGTYEKGFSLNVIVSKTHTLLLNGVQVVFPDMFRGDCLVVHGFQHVFSRHNVKQHHHAKHDTYRVTDAQDYDEHEVSSHSPEFDDDNRHACLQQRLSLGEFFGKKNTGAFDIS